MDSLMEIDLPKEFSSVLSRFTPKEIDFKRPKIEEVTSQEMKQNKKNKISLTELKSRAKKPENVEWVDCDAKDPIFLVELKSKLNVVPVPAHWSSKRKYLQSKRGIEKMPYELPKYIKDTNISELRQAGKEKEDQQKLKQKVRARLHGKIHKLEIDYQILHDAFFKHQEKPQMTKFGECFYEGKEFELKVKAQRAGGNLSDELKRALGMGPKDPPSYLYNMQRYGPPPSYPGLKIPGVNAPIPKGSSWGYHSSGYGKPPVDLHGRSLYGDVFGIEEKKKTNTKYWIKPEPRFGEMIDDQPDEMEIEDIKNFEPAVDMQNTNNAAIPVENIGPEREKPNNRPKMVHSPINKQESLYTIIGEEKVSVQKDVIVGSEKKYNIKTKDPIKVEEQRPKKRSSENSKSFRKKFKY
eukprot:NODE_298_length_10484_cov_0.802600.p3 type:complete len:409 gc:universal NODE_298_length_10484_cov_0.802600:3425-2199(-)